MKNKVYLLSGPAGVGKSTTSKQLVKKLPRSAFISGDKISHMHVNGRKEPWEKEEHSLIWGNILSLTKNFIAYGNDIVIDYVTFPQDVEWFLENLKPTNIELIYVVLWTDPETLLNRDRMRITENRMGERCLILMDEFLESGLDKKHLLDTSKYNTSDITNVIHEIMNNPRFIIERSVKDEN